MNQFQIQQTSDEIELSIQAQKMIALGLNPCDHCENLYWITEEEVEIKEAEHMVEKNVLGIKIMMQLCHEHYLEDKLLEMEE